MNKEEIYDSEISPLMAQIIAICKARGIAMLASFSIPTEDDPDLVCTTSLPDENGKQPQDIQRAVDCIYGNAPPPLRLTTRDKDGRVIRDEIVLG